MNMKLIYHIAATQQIVVVHVLIPKYHYQNIFIISQLVFEVCISFWPLRQKALNPYSLYRNLPPALFYLVYACFSEQEARLKPDLPLFSDLAGLLNSS